MAGPFIPTAFCDVQKLWTALHSVSIILVEAIAERDARVDTHIHLHIDTLLEIVHDARNACLEVGPSIKVSFQTPGAHDRATHVAPMSSLLGMGGIWVGAAIFAAIMR